MVAEAKRRGHGDDSIYFDAGKNRWVGAVSLGRGADGKRQRRKITGKTKSEVRLKLRALREEIAAGAKTSARYTVERAVEDWLREGLDGRAPRTVELYEGLLKPVVANIGAVPLRDLSAHEVRDLLTKIAEKNSTRTVQIVRNCLERAVTHAQANDHVARNVVAVVKAPQGHAVGRPSKSLDPEQAASVLKAAEGSRLHAYVVLSLLTGIRTEEARALRWEHVDLDAGTISVWRSDRHGGDTKTAKSRRTLALPQVVSQALKRHRKAQAEEQLAAGEDWRENDLVFCTKVGTAMDRHNVLREFRKVTKRADIGDDWVPRELRHSFVSVLSSHGVSIEEIARLAGHTTTRTTELVYRKELRPALTRGAEVMDEIFRPATA